MTAKPTITVTFSVPNLPEANLVIAGWDESIVVPEAECFARQATGKGLRLEVRVKAPDQETEDRLLAYFCDLYGELIADGIPPLDIKYLKGLMDES